MNTNVYCAEAEAAQIMRMDGEGFHRQLERDQRSPVGFTGPDGGQYFVRALIENYRKTLDARFGQRL
ncbi:hypothetical protein [Mesorhizobium sp. DCY119]|uniref:hypothetical protein n=1 Tax=Mesorhizobium sp. DCY119 TaxID=2108445 RepID=UPI000E6B5ED0|nr:hypothetical protein [Mesorhizobium sp. DCY119]RJG43726.1 hypothetical protein D3Y55_05265 [Mesorhizobium sp. DCY119]